MEKKSIFRFLINYFFKFFNCRLEVIYMPNTSVTYLRIRNVQLSDEAIYKCEITYIEVKENCDLVQAIQLETLGMLYLVHAVRKAAIEQTSVFKNRKLVTRLTKLSRS